MKEVKLYLEEQDWKRLEAKARDAGFIGRGAIIKYIRKVATEPICFLDGNVKALLQMMGSEK